MRERDRLRNAVTQLLAGRPPDDHRLAQEIALLADKLDITEELVRFRQHHVAAARAALAADRPVGKQLGFLAQELGREVNTMGAKANDAEIPQAGHRDEGRAGEISGTAREPRVKPFLLVLSSPSGGGKTTIARQLVRPRDDLGYSVSATTRPPADGEGTARTTTSCRGTNSCAGRGRATSSSGRATAARCTARSGRDRRATSPAAHAVLDIELQGARQIRADRAGGGRGVRAAAVGVPCWPTGWRGATRNAEPRCGTACWTGGRRARRVGEYDYVVVNDDLVVQCAGGCHYRGRVASGQPSGGLAAVDVLHATPLQAVEQSSGSAQEPGRRYAALRRQSCGS